LGLRSTTESHQEAVQVNRHTLDTDDIHYILSTRTDVPSVGEPSGLTPDSIVVPTVKPLEQREGVAAAGTQAKPKGKHKRGEFVSDLPMHIPQPSLGTELESDASDTAFDPEVDLPEAASSEKSSSDGNLPDVVSEIMPAKVRIVR
jgi:hypothetical protein